MNPLTRPPSRRALAPATAGAVLLLAGCQSYKPAPLDLGAHRVAFDARLSETERLARFAERLRAEPAPAPERFDPADGLSCAEGEVLALFYNAELRLTRLDAGLALADFETAGLWDDPVFGFDGADIVSPAAPFEFGLMLSFTIPISGRLEVEKERAGGAYEAELRRIVDAEWTLRYRVRQAWGAWTTGAERLRVLAEVVERLRPVVAVTEALEAAGELAQVDGRLIRVELAQRTAELEQVRLTVERRRLDLLRLMGLSPRVRVELLPELPGVGAPTDADLVGRLIAHNTALAVRRAEYTVAEETLRLEVRKQYPDITVGAGYGSEDRDDRLLLGVSMPVPILNANRAGIADARARRDIARANAETAFEQLDHELALARATLAAAVTQRAEYEAAIVPDLDTQIDEVDRLAELGEVDTLLLLESVTRAYDARSHLLELRLAELDASLDIARLLGPDEPAAPAPVAEPEQSARPQHTEPLPGEAP